MKNLKITAKLLVGFGLILVLVIILGTVSINQLNKLNQTSESFAKISIPAVDNIWTARRSLLSIQRYLLQIIATNDAKEFEDDLAAITEDRNALMAALDNTVELIPDYAPQVEVIKADISAAGKYREQIVNLAKTLTPESNIEAYKLFTNQYVPVFDKVAKELVNLYDDIKTRVDTRVNSANATATASFILVAMVLGIVVLITVIATILITNSIKKPVKELEVAAKKLAKGELDVNITYQSKDELGVLSSAMREAMTKFQFYIGEITYALGEFANNNFAIRDPKEHFIGDFKVLEDSIACLMTNLSATLNQIKVACDQVSSGSDQVSSGAQALAQGATEQASSVEELSASITEISGQVKQNADNSSKANSMASEAARAIDASNTQMQNLMAAMTKINTKSSEISKIIKTIEDIAFQTNILALNAAVEAARAGAAGKGFAVVADEVRNLAGKSADAAKNTTVLIEDSVSSIGDGVKLAETTAKDLVGAVESVKRTTELISEITAASNEQATFIAQVTIGVDQISSVVQTNSATSEESAAASEELSSQATLMKELVGKFTLMGDHPMFEQSSFSPSKVSSFSSYEAPGLPSSTVSFESRSKSFDAYDHSSKY